MYFRMVNVAESQIYGLFNALQCMLLWLLVCVVVAIRQLNKMESSLIERKNKQQLTRLNRALSDYEAKLDQRVATVIQEIIGYTKKLMDPPLQPLLPKKHQMQTKNPYPVKQRVKSVSYKSDVSFLSDRSGDSSMEMLKDTFKQFQSMRIIGQPGRAAGSYSAHKPKFHKKKPDILPRQMRLNPFSEKNAIKAYELERGLYSLLEKGKIGKDVNVITAFEKGNPVLQAQKAIFHEGEERFAELETDHNELKGMVVQKPESGEKKGTMKTEKQIDTKLEYHERKFEESWALTMPKDSDYGYGVSHEGSSMMALGQFKEEVYIKMGQYKPVHDSNYHKLMNKHLELKGELIQLLGELGRVMHLYSIEIAYANGTQLLALASRVSRPSKQQLLGCLVVKGQNYTALKQVRGQEQKIRLAIDRVISAVKSNHYRRDFLLYMSKKRLANKIYWWAVSCWAVKKHRETINVHRKQVLANFHAQQEKLSASFSQIEEQKHYEIHLVNQPVRRSAAHSRHRQAANIQLTRIFNIRNANKHIIFILPCSLQEQTINYYYKIMELEEIPNYRERVSFMEVDPTNVFRQRFNLSRILYYSSPTLRKLRKKIKNTPAYFVISYPNTSDYQLAEYMGIPIKGGDYLDLAPFQQRVNTPIYGIDTMPFMSIDGRIANLTSLSDAISKHCHTTKGCDKFIVKLNETHRSNGSALLSSPFDSLPQMYANTTLINEGKTVDEFYHALLREGGIIQQYEEGLVAIEVVIEISPLGHISIVGSFEKISSGFVNVAYTFPQKRVDAKWLGQKVRRVGEKLHEAGHYGEAELTFLVDDMQEIFLQKVQCYLTHLGSALYYYRFLSQGELKEEGEYIAKIVQTYQKQGGTQEEIVTFQSRTFCYVPYLLHFGLSERQTNSFFQLCRMGGVSFDLENKYGATFILLGPLHDAMGMITTARDKRGALKLMLKSLEFILKQNSHNMSNQRVAEKEARMKERENILNVKERLEDM